MLPTKFRFIWPNGFRGEELKKLEETFKIREKSLTEQRKSRIEMETYCNKLEAKNTGVMFI
jgi:hypothetical protein